MYVMLCRLLTSNLLPLELSKELHERKEKEKSASKWGRPNADAVMHMFMLDGKHLAADSACHARRSPSKAANGTKCSRKAPPENGTASTPRKKAAAVQNGGPAATKKRKQKGGAVFAELQTACTQVTPTAHTRPHACLWMAGGGLLGVPTPKKLHRPAAWTSDEESSTSEEEDEPLAKRAKKAQPGKKAAPAKKSAEKKPPPKRKMQV